MKEMFEQVIAMKNYDLKTLLANIDQYHIEGRLTDEERLDLTMQARKGAEPEYDYAGEINALWAAVRELQQMVRRTKDGGSSCSPRMRVRLIRWATR